MSASRVPEVRNASLRPAIIQPCLGMMDLLTGSMGLTLFSPVAAVVLVGRTLIKGRFMVSQTAF